MTAPKPKVALLVLLIFLLTFLGLLWRDTRPPIYTKTEITSPEVGHFEVAALSDKGHITGEAWLKEGGHAAFLWHRKTGIQFFARGLRVHPNDVNSSGTVVGCVFHENELGEKVKDAFVWSATGDIWILPSPSGGSISFHRINDRGLVAGVVTTESGETRVVLWRRETGFQDLGDLGLTAPCLHVCDLNEKGIVLVSTMAGSPETEREGHRVIYSTLLPKGFPVSGGWDTGLPSHSVLVWDPEYGTRVIGSADEGVWHPRLLAEDGRAMGAFQKAGQPSFTFEWNREGGVRLMNTAPILMNLQGDQITRHATIQSRVFGRSPTLSAWAVRLRLHKWFPSLMAYRSAVFKIRHRGKTMELARLFPESEHWLRGELCAMNERGEILLMAFNASPGEAHPLPCLLSPIEKETQP